MSLSTSNQPASSIPTSIVISNATERKKESITLAGGCFCRNITYTLRLDTLDDAMTSLCHCASCKKAFGGPFGLSAKVPLQRFRYGRESATPVTFVGVDNGTNVYREFCRTCGSPICQYGEGTKDHFRYVAIGSLDDPSALPPKAEFHCEVREEWLPEIPGLFRRQKGEV